MPILLPLLVLLIFPSIPVHIPTEPSLHCPIVSYTHTHTNTAHFYLELYLEKWKSNWCRVTEQLKQVPVLANVLLGWWWVVAMVPPSDGYVISGDCRCCPANHVVNYAIRRGLTWNRSVCIEERLTLCCCCALCCCCSSKPRFFPWALPRESVAAWVELHPVPPCTSRCWLCWSSFKRSSCWRHCYAHTHTKISVPMSALSWSRVL